MNLMRPFSDPLSSCSVAATPSAITVCTSCPQACIFPGTLEAKPRPVASWIGSASMSARIPMVRPGSAPSSMATIPVLPTPVLNGIFKRLRYVSTALAVSCSSNASSGCSCSCLRRATSSGARRWVLAAMCWARSCLSTSIWQYCCRILGGGSMKRILLLIAACFCAMAHAQPYPNRPIKFVVPFPPGGNLDFVARSLQPKMQEVLGQPVLIDNKGGAAGMIGLEYASKQPGDGYTIVLGNTGTVAINVSIYPKIPYDPITDFVAIGITTTNALMATIAANVPANNLQEFVAYAKKNPGKLNFGISGAGSGPHFGAEMFKRAAGLDIPVVFYKGSGPVVQDLLGGQVQVQMDAPSVTMTHVKAGKLKALAVTGKTRLASLPEVPTFDQAGLPGVDATGFQGVLAPAGTPPAAVARLSDALQTALAQPEVRERFATQGLDAAFSTPEQFAAFIRAEIQKWARLAKEAYIKAER